MGKVLSEADVDQFVERGHCIVKGAFPQALADRALDQVWAELPCDRDDPTTWTERFHHVPKAFDGGPFTASWTDRVHDAFDDLLGEGRWNRRTEQGWWPVIFPGFDAGPWRPPADGWHVDGQQFHHHVDSPDQALLPIFVWSDIGPGDGGTAIAEGSHRVTARILAEHEPAGLDHVTLTNLVAAEPRPSVVEANAEAGDVVLLHPFVLHTGSANTGTRVRFITNPCITFKDPMDLRSPTSVVERSIADAVAGILS
jgi:hypothetical protein